MIDQKIVTHRWAPAPPEGKLKFSRDAQGRVSWELTLDHDATPNLLDAAITEALRADRALREALTPPPVEGA